MSPHHFHQQLHHHQIVQAIHEAERGTTGHIHVYIAHTRAANPIAAAERRFQKLKLHRHPEHNEILIFVAPKSQTFAIIGDRSIHEKAGDETWRSLAAQIAAHFKSERYGEAITHAIGEVGVLLSTHFPKSVGMAADH